MEKELSPKESLEIISNAIAQAKKNVVRGGSFQIIWWGWIIAIANLGQYTLTKMEYAAPYVVWILVIPAIIVSVIHGYKMSKSSRVTTHLDSIYGQIWLAAFIVIMIVVIFMTKLNFHHSPVILGIAGIGMYTTGVLLRFKPVIYGAIVLWIASIIGFNISITDQYLLAGIAIILGYLVPGYMLKRAEK